MIQNIGDCLRFEPRVERIEHGPSHGQGVMQFEQLWDIGG